MIAPTESYEPETEPQSHDALEPRTGLTGMVRRLVRTAAASAARRQRWREVAQMRSLSNAYLRDIGMSRFGVAWSVPHAAARPALRRSS